MNTQDRKNNREYAGQLAVVKRREKNISVKESYSKLEDSQDRPFLQVLSPFSVNRLNILDTSKRVKSYNGQMLNVSLYANIPHQDVAGFVKRADNAMLMIMLYEQGMMRPSASVTPNQVTETAGSPTHAFDMLNVGPLWKGKNPGDEILNATNLQEIVDKLANQRNFLLPNIEKYKLNKADMAAIDEALILLDEEIANDIIRNGKNYNKSRVSQFAMTYKPENTKLFKRRPSQAVMEAKTSAANGIRIYPSAKKGGKFNEPTKPFKGEYVLRKEDMLKIGSKKNGETIGRRPGDTIYRWWYKLVITCDVTRDQPFHFHIENFYAPANKTGDLENPDTTRSLKVSEYSKGKDEEEFDMTENEFVMFVDNIKFNHDTVKMVWYNNARKEDVARRFQPDPSKSA